MPSSVASCTEARNASGPPARTPAPTGQHHSLTSTAESFHLDPSAGINARWERSAHRYSALYEVVGAPLLPSSVVTRPMQLHAQLAEMHYQLQLHDGLTALAATQELRAVVSGLPDTYRLRKVERWAGSYQRMVFLAWGYNLSLLGFLLVLLFAYYLTLQHSAFFKADDFWRTFFLVTVLEPIATQFLKIAFANVALGLISFCLLGVWKKKEDKALKTLADAAMGRRSSGDSRTDDGRRDTPSFGPPLIHVSYYPACVRR